jgi:hypothetical protein
MLEYVLVFDAGTAPVMEWADLGPVVAVAVVAVVFWLRQARAVPGYRAPGFFGSPATVACLATVVLFLVGVLTVVGYSERNWLRNRLRNGEYTQVEGHVQDFIPGDRQGHREESWSVRSKGETYTYRYRTPDQVPGFHQSAGPIREGQRVRIADVDGYIARLEIEK